MAVVDEATASYDFADDFLYFYQDRTSEARSDEEAKLIRRLLDYGPDANVLDLACGSGRIANRLAGLGGRISGIDRSASLISRARAQAADRGVHVDYSEGDMREFSRHDEFDAVVCWYTSFGYFDDLGNLALLERCRRSLRPVGQLLLELNNRDELLRNYLPSIVVRRGDDFLVDENSFDPHSGRTTIRRTIVRDDRIVRASFSIRLFCFNELRDWLLRVGFSDVAVYSGDGNAFSSRSPRMIVIGRH